MECKCKIGTTYEAGPKKCAFNTGCSDYCKGTCIVQNDPNNCVDCNDPLMDKIPASISGIFQCSCPSGKTLDPVSKACIFSSGCDARCNGKCGVQNDNTKCITSCGADASVDTGAVPAPYIKCICNSDFDFLKNQCIRKNGCNWKCGGHCTVPSDNTKCFETCKKPTYISTLQSTDVYQCDCPADALLEDGSIGECIYTIGCSDTCFSQCINKNDESACYVDCKGGNVIKTLISTDIYHCTCPPGSRYDASFSQCIYFAGCDDACASECINQHDSNACIGDCANNAVLSKNVTYTFLILL